MSARAFDAAEVAAELGAAGLQVSVDAPFGELTTYGVGGRAAVLVEVVSAADAVAAGDTSLDEINCLAYTGVAASDANEDGSDERDGTFQI